MGDLRLEEAKSWCCENKGLGCPRLNETETSGSEATSSALPPWWILKGVKPAGAEKSMGTWKAIAFSKEQQAKYGVDEDGTIVNRTKFDPAFANSTTPTMKT